MRSMPTEPDGAVLSIATPWMTLWPTSTRTPGSGLASWKSIDEQSPVAVIVWATAGREPTLSAAAAPKGATSRRKRKADRDIEGLFLSQSLVSDSQRW